MRLSRLQQNFESLAAEDPLWTVLSDNSKRGGKWDPEEFFASGEGTIAHLEARLAELKIPLAGDTALDFGCGVGRLTFPLGKRFREVTGIDISESMITAAKQNLHRGGNCKFLLNTSDSLNTLENESLDFVYSDIVFQHIAPRYSRGYFLEIARTLKPGGYFAFQLPSHLNPESKDNQKPFRLLRKKLHYRLKGISQSIGLGKAYFEMNSIPRKKLIHFLESKTQLQHLAHWEYAAAGPNWISYLYLFRKR